MVLLPCSACCETCTCAACSCCRCNTWQSIFDKWEVPSLPSPYNSWGYTESYYNEVYADLVAILPNCISRLYGSQSDCVNARVAQAMSAYPGMTEQEIRDAFQAYWEETECQPYISKVPYGSGWHGWSVPYVDGVVASPAALTAKCPSGAPPSPLNCQAGYTAYSKISEWTTGGIPVIRLLVLTASTGDAIADAMLTLGTLPDLPADNWLESADCGTCDTPRELEFDCAAAEGIHRAIYAKTLSVRNSRVNGNDELSLCPPENCKIVTITLTRTDYCESLIAPTITIWTVEVAICPCQPPFIMQTPLDDNDEPIVSEAYGYQSEADCMALLDPDSACTNDQWKLVRVSDDGGVPIGLVSECVATAAVECCQ